MQACYRYRFRVKNNKLSPVTTGIFKVSTIGKVRLVSIFQQHTLFAVLICRRFGVAVMAAYSGTEASADQPDVGKMLADYWQIDTVRRRQNAPHEWQLN